MRRCTASRQRAQEVTRGICGDNQRALCPAESGIDWTRFEKLKDFLAQCIAKHKQQVATDVRANKLVELQLRTFYQLVRLGFYGALEVRCTLTDELRVRAQLLLVIAAVIPNLAAVASAWCGAFRSTFCLLRARGMACINKTPLQDTINHTSSISCIAIVAIHYASSVCF